MNDNEKRITINGQDFILGPLAAQNWTPELESVLEEIASLSTLGSGRIDLDEEGNLILE